MCVWGGGFNGGTNGNKSLAMLMDYSSVYDNENEEGKCGGWGKLEG